MSNERETALHEYEQGVQRLPSDADLWYNIGYLYLTGADNEMAHILESPLHSSLT